MICKIFNLGKARKPAESPRWHTVPRALPGLPEHQALAQSLADIYSLRSKAEKLMSL